MAQGITPDNLNLLNGLDISHRLKARVGAFLKSMISVTPALLETAEAGSEFEKLLLSPGLLKAGTGLTADLLEEILSSYSEDVQDTVVLEKQENGYTVLMLLDEQIAGDIFDQVPAASAEVEKGVAVRTSTSEITAARADTVNQEELKSDPASLKMTVLTSPDTAAKIEAIRIMLFSNHDVIDKGDLFFAALGDDDNTVRSEALKAMNKIGLDADLADSMLAFCNAPANMLPVSIKRLAGILKKVSDAEAVIGTRILVSRLKDNVSLENRNAVLLTLAGVIEKIITDKPAVREISEQVLRVFIREPDRLESGVDNFFRKVLPFGDEELLDYLYREQFRIEDVRISAVIGALVLAYVRDEDRKQKVISNILDNLNEISGKEDNKRRILNTLGMMEDSTIYDGLITRFGGYDRDIQIALMYFTGTAIRRNRLSPEQKNRLVDELMDILRLEDSKLIIVLLETGILSDADLLRDKKKTIARELIRIWNAFTIPYLHYAIEDTLVHLGIPAAEVMFSYISTYPDSDINMKISPILGENISRADRDSSDEDKAVFKSCLKDGIRLFESDLPCKGVVAEMLGRASCSSLMTKRDLNTVYAMLTDSEDYVEHRLKILEALGWLGSSPKMELEQKVELAARFQRLLNVRLPEVKSKMKVEDDTNIFFMGAEADLYSEFLPIVIESLKRIGVNVRTGSQLQKSILDSILRMWRRTASWELILGPAASNSLVDCLSGFGCIPDLGVETKKVILTNLLQWKNQLFVLKAIGAMAANGNEGYGLSSLYGEVVEQILGMIQRENDVYSEKEKLTMLDSYASIVNNRKIDPKNREYGRYIDQGIQFLVRGYKEGVRQAYPWLEELGNNIDVPENFRDEIGDILKTLRNVSVISKE